MYNIIIIFGYHTRVNVLYKIKNIHRFKFLDDVSSRKSLNNEALLVIGVIFGQLQCKRKTRHEYEYFLSSNKTLIFSELSTFLYIAMRMESFGRICVNQSLTKWVRAKELDITLTYLSTRLVWEMLITWLFSISFCYQWHQR